MKPEMYDHWKRPEKKPEENSGELIVETAGYIPAQQQVLNLINAGRRLDDYRRENYDFGNDEQIDDNFIDPTRDPNFDMADASALAQETEQRLTEQANEAEQSTETNPDPEPNTESNSDPSTSTPSA